MLYTSDEQDFEHQVHPALKRRIRMFLIIATIMTAIVLYDIVEGTLGILVALASIVVGAAIGLFTSRIFHLTWERDGEKVVGSIDTVGWVVLALYIVFEIARSYLFAEVIHLHASTTAITFAFVASALAARVLGLRGRILNVLKEEKVFGR